MEDSTGQVDGTTRREGQAVDFAANVKMRSGINLGGGEPSDEDLAKVLEGLSPAVRGVLLYVVGNQRSRAAEQQATATVLTAGVVVLDKACEDIESVHDGSCAAGERQEKLYEVHNSLALLMENLKELVKPKEA